MWLLLEEFWEPASQARRAQHGSAAAGHDEGAESAGVLCQPRATGGSPAVDATVSSSALAESSPAAAVNAVQAWGKSSPEYSRGSTRTSQFPELSRMTASTP